MAHYCQMKEEGGLITWKILNKNHMSGNTIHYLEEGIDTGQIVLQNKTNIDKERPLPIDYLKSEKINAEIIIDKFLEILLNNNIPSIEQNNDRSFYYPRLFTEINGIINWDWDIDSIEVFIRAFGYPYPGASSYYRDHKVHILEAFIDEDFKDTYHPFMNGKIVTVLENGSVRVIAGSRSLIISLIAIDGQEQKPGDFLSIKYTFNSPAEKLIYSKLHIPTTLSMN